MMTNDEGGTILRNMKDEYVNGGMLSTAEVRGDIGDPTNLLIHSYEVTAEREKKASKGNKMGREQRCFAKWCFRILSKFCFVMILCSVKKYFAERRTINTMKEMQKTVSLVNHFVLFFPQSVLIIGQKVVFTLILGSFVPIFLRQKVHLW